MVGCHHSDRVSYRWRLGNLHVLRTLAGYRRRARMNELAGCLKAGETSGKNLDVSSADINYQHLHEEFTYARLTIIRPRPGLETTS